MPEGGQVYFQEPPEHQMTYPCILYQRDREDKKFANNSPYANTKRYQATIIDEDPDSEIVDKFSALPMTTFSRHFRVDRLNHDIYNIYY